MAPLDVDWVRIADAAGEVDAAARCECVGVVEGVEGVASVDFEFEALVETLVEYLDCDAVRGLAPVEPDLDSVARPYGELPAVCGGGGHVGSSFMLGREHGRECPPRCDGFATGAPL